MNPHTSMIEPELPRLRELRRDLHAHPQLAYQETYASDRICAELDRLGIPYTRGLAETGIVAWVTPGDPGSRTRPAIAFRADMDALPIHETTGVPYASCTDGVMHACGHDGHMTLLLGLAAVLAQVRDRLPQPVKLIFQPAEEQAAGAARMIEAGALSAQWGDAAIGRLIGFHNWPGLDLGRFAIKRGAFFASADLFRVVVRGRGGHGAMPHLGSDAILAAAHIICALQSIVSRNLDPVRPGVVSVGSIHAGTAENILPGEVVFEGTIRAMDEGSRALLHRRVGEVAAGVAAGLGCEAEAWVEQGYPVLTNEDGCVEFVQDSVVHAAGREHLDILTEPVLGAEDFAFYVRHVPAAYFLFGVRGTGGATSAGLHNSGYDFNDDALGRVLPVLATMALAPADVL
ncbi:MAG: amidohydrolase [Verrucomicrobiota bacterium]|nr:amidohydrolase [Verrucomicrobiota bacterium]